MVANPGIATVRIAPDNATVLQQLGLLGELVGTWTGGGFNLIARPDFHDTANLYLQLNQTRETLTIDPIGSAIPNRGFGQDDIELFGLTYLQKISDLPTGGALHIEPGLWVTQPATTYPPETAPAGEQIVFRQGSIPHGTSLLAQGTAQPFSGPPTLQNGTTEYAFSQFPSFNSTPYGAGGPISAAGSSDKGSGGAFQQYDLTQPDGPTNPRTPFNTNPPDPPLPAAINGVPMQDVVNDPITLVQKVISDQVAAGSTFEGVAINIATQPAINFRTKVNEPVGDPPSQSVSVSVTDAAGGLANIPFLDGEQGAGKPQPNAHSALVYATFWIEKVTPRGGYPFMQLQYAQFTELDFPILDAPVPTPTTEPPTPPRPNLGWPHISVATLRKTFN
jgi:hypothetical protein